MISSGPLSIYETFKGFQALSDAARELVVQRTRRRTIYQLRHAMLWDMKSANDNEESEEIKEEFDQIVLSDIYVSMLACWVACDRDMLVTKLTWDSTNQHTWTLD